ncbi:flavodoxin family protein [Alkalicoccobacillus porphyridii]|uniref:Flavodoxin family protein n=1 Tax=Alkalicoccobacillus porphyridii TaxID=2597270 RepID=A0A554A1D6_9BACI|nr:flavodoxin family protein [Alkalicoccobacillus porphyridii]TSB47511.1 flavodoxin family protein [Alkalicoccobacillus porphyridii]
MKIGIFYGSTREGGNTEALTEEVVNGLAEVERVHLREYHILDMVDQRHAQGGFSSVDDDYDKLIDTLLESEVLLFATPIYWYGFSSVMKRFIDRWSQLLRDERYPDAKNRLASKKAYLIAVGGDQPRVKGLPLVEQFKHICAFSGLQYSGYVLGTGNRPNDIYQDTEALEEARELGEKLKLNLR